VPTADGVFGYKVALPGKTVPMSEYLKNSPVRAVKTPEELGLTPKNPAMGEPTGLTTKPGEVRVQEVGGAAEGDMLRRNEAPPTGEEVNKTASDYLKEVKPQLEKGLGVEEEDLSSHPETAELQQAGMKKADAARVTDRLKNLDNTNGFPQWAMENGFDMGDKLIGRNKAGLKAGTHVERADVINDILTRKSPQELADSVDEFLANRKKGK
jgi:hypothetical protein